MSASSSGLPRLALFRSSSRLAVLLNFLLLVCLMRLGEQLAAVGGHTPDYLLMHALGLTEDADYVEEMNAVPATGVLPHKRPEKPSAPNWETVRTTTGDLFNITWPVKKAATVEGQIVLGGLMMVRESASCIG